MQQLAIIELLQDSLDPPLTRATLKTLQSKLGLSLPADYVEFLLHFNGGWFQKPVMFYVPDTDRWSDGVCVSEFLGESGEELGSGSLSLNANLYEGRIPAGYLTIANCGGLDSILLYVDDGTANFGHVYFWDGTEEAEGDNIHWVAESFTEFLSMLMYDTYFDDLRDEQETLPIFLAIERGRAPEVERYLAAGNDIETRNAKGLTLLAAAVHYTWPKIVNQLLIAGADPNSKDHEGKTPLHHAAQCSLDCVKLLVSAGADLQARDLAGKGVIGNWYFRADQYLRAHGAIE
ncbi:MAG: SMI1/KNR4 family protein [Pirellulales bacterium]|nr:SMI1/KNR4 family protein [Pirellulales bacterium]